MLFRSKEITKGTTFDPRDYKTIEKIPKGSFEEIAFRVFPAGSIAMLLSYERESYRCRDDEDYDLYQFLIGDQIAWMVWNNKRRSNHPFSKFWEQISE
jgi:hypothetical protein